MSALTHLIEVFAEGGHGDNAEKFAAELLAERDAEIVAWLLKKAREYGTSNRESRDKAEAVERMASKLSRGAVRENNTAMLPADFFQIGLTYTYEASGFTAPELIVIFRPEHITRHPERGHRRAIGWSRTGEPGAKWHGDFYDEDQFDGWSPVAEVEKDTREGESTPPADELTIYRASHESIVMGHYTTREAAREHCETLMRREVGEDVLLGWVPDHGGEDAPEELCTGEDVECTGYVVTPLPVASEYDEEADE